MNRLVSTKKMRSGFLAALFFLNFFCTHDALAFGRKHPKPTLDLHGWYSGSLESFSSSENIRVLINPAAINTQGQAYYFLALQSLLDPNKILLKYQLFVRDGQIVAVNALKNDTIIFASTSNNGMHFQNGSDSSDIILTNNENHHILEIDSSIGHDKYKLSLNQTDDLMPASTSPSIDEVIAQAKWKSYSTQTEAEQVFQAKQNINKARGALIPGISLKAVIGIFTGDYLSVIGAAVPFIFPSNWFALSASKALYQAERDSFISVRGNTMNMAEGLYYVVLRDKEVLDDLSSEVTWMENVLKQIQTEEALNTLPQGSSDYFISELSAIKRDQRALKSLVEQNYAELAQIIAVDPIFGITSIQNIPLPDLSGPTYLNPKSFLDIAINKSYEIASLGEIKKAAQSMMYESVFSFLSPEAGTNLGFGTIAQIKFSQSEQTELNVKIDETKSILARSAKQISERYNSAVDSYSLSAQGLSSVQKMMDRRMWQHAGGSDTSEQDFAKDIIENMKKLIEFKADFRSAIMAYRISESQKNRITLEGYYNNIDQDVPAF